MISVIFDEKFSAGREFILNFTKIVNPITIGTGFLKFYATDFTSNFVNELDETTIKFETAQNTLPIVISLANEIPLSGPVALYKSASQYIKIAFTADANIPAGSTIEYDFPSGNTLIPGTLYVSPSYLPKTSGTSVTATYATNKITISNINTLVLGTTYFI